MNFSLILFACVVILQSMGQILEKFGMTQVGQISDIGGLKPYMVILPVLLPYFYFIYTTIQLA